MTMVPIAPGSPGCYENYPSAPVLPRRSATMGRAVGRGTVTGMAAASVTIVTVLPPLIGLAGEPAGWVFVLGFYTVAAAVVGTLPGALAGALLWLLARAGASPLPLRLAGGAAGAAAAALVSAPLFLTSWPGAVVAALCGAFAARWVADGPDARPSDD